MAFTDLEELVSNPDYTTKIVLGNGKVITGFLESDFTFGGSAEWTSLTEEMGGAQKQVATAYNASMMVKNSLTGSASGNISLKSFKSTVQVYTGSASPSFNLQLLFIATKKDSNVTEPIKDLLEAVFSNSQAGSLELMKTPFDYAADLQSILQGGCSLYIGSWFATPPQLVIKAVTPVFSKEIMTNGNPLFARCTVDLVTFRTPTYDEVKEWFRL